MLRRVRAWQCASPAVLTCVDQFRVVRLRHLRSTVLYGESLTASGLACVAEWRGRLFVTQWHRHHILVVFNCATDTDPITARWGLPGHLGGEFYHPRGLVVHEPTQTLLVCDHDNRRVQVLNGHDGTFLRQWKTRRFPDLVCVAPTGEVLVSDDLACTVDVFDFASGQLLRSVVAQRCATIPVWASPSLLCARGDMLLVVGKVAAHFDARTGALLCNRPVSVDPACLVWDTQVVAGDAWSNAVHVWRAADLASAGAGPRLPHTPLATTASCDGHYWFVLWQQNGPKGTCTGVDVWRTF